jgi:hypothetical protein
MLYVEWAPKIVGDGLVHKTIMAITLLLLVDVKIAKKQEC